MTTNREDSLEISSQQSATVVKLSSCSHIVNGLKGGWPAAAMETSSDSSKHARCWVLYEQHGLAEG
jgi:hypothetical protein